MITAVVVLVIAVATSCASDDLKVTKVNGYVNLEGETELPEEDVVFVPGQIPGKRTRVKRAASTIPEELNWKVAGMMPEAVYQGLCNICGYVSGTQAMASLVGIATENYQPWSIQNILVCQQASKLCAGAQPTRINNIVREHEDYVVPEEDNPFMHKKCLTYKNCTCIDSTSVSSHHHLLRDTQWFFMGPVVEAKSVNELKEALQRGPVTTCYDRAWKLTNGDTCRPGCSHANTIIGYDKKRWYLQESLGKGFDFPKVPGKRDPQLHNGTWWVNRKTQCETAIINKAKYSVVFFDYDRANAYFKPETVGMDGVELLDVTLFKYTKKEVYPNMGLAKRRCSLLAKHCAGVLEDDDGVLKLVAKIGGGKGAAGNLALQRKVHMVIYLKHSSGQYLGISSDTMKLVPVATKEEAAPFFTSEHRIISFEYPEYTLGNKGLQKHDIEEPDVTKTGFELESAILQNLASGSVIDMDSVKDLTGRSLSLSSATQRFSIKLSGRWLLYSDSVGTTLGVSFKPRYTFHPDEKKFIRVYFRWQARAIIFEQGFTFLPDWNRSGELFHLGDKTLEVAPTDAKLKHSTSGKYLGIKGGDVKMLSSAKNDADLRWTFEYGDL